MNDNNCKKQPDDELVNLEFTTTLQSMITFPFVGWKKWKYSRSLSQSRMPQEMDFLLFTIAKVTLLLT
jgi:hypothetical protein